MVNGEVIEMTPEEIAELEASLGPPPTEPQPQPKAQLAEPDDDDDEPHRKEKPHARRGTRR